MNTMVIGMSIAACVMIYGVWCVIHPKIKIPKLGVYKNKRKERKLLNVLLRDMKKNTGNWLVDIEQFNKDSNLIVNDKKNMAVRYGDQRITLFFNLKDIATLTADGTDTLRITIIGEPAKKFIKKAIGMLDHRGKELSYFTRKIEERL